MKTLFPLTMTDKVSEAAQFYQQLFGMVPTTELDWYIQLQHPDNPSMQLAFMQHDHESVPPEYRSKPAGVVISLEFDSVAELFSKAQDLGFPIKAKLRDEIWGQRHFITQDPTGLAVDVIEPIEPNGRIFERKRHVMNVRPR